MPDGWQEIAALLIVVAVAAAVIIAQLRRRKARKGPSCCDAGASPDKRENVVRFYRRTNSD